ncbi:MAG: hypothetical protein LBR22_04180 [Desulfovibrio sp.]|nr:hypothetical protein [Desulfovibrio sp.]
MPYSMTQCDIIGPHVRKGDRREPSAGLRRPGAKVRPQSATSSMRNGGRLPSRPSISPHGARPPAKPPKGLAGLVLALCTCLLPWLSPVAVLADEDGNMPKYAMRIVEVDQALEACIEKAAGTTKAILLCYEDAITEMDVIMEDSFGKLLVNIGGDVKYVEALKRDQSAWWALREEAVSHVRAINGSGNISRIAGSEHRFWLTRNRAEMLGTLAVTSTPGD